MTLFQKGRNDAMGTILHCNGCGCEERVSVVYFNDIVAAKADYEGYDMKNKKEAAIAEELAIDEEMRSLGHAYCKIWNPEDEDDGWDAGADADEYYDRTREMGDK